MAKGPAKKDSDAAKAAKKAAPEAKAPKLSRAEKAALAEQVKRGGTSAPSTPKAAKPAKPGKGAAPVGKKGPDASKKVGPPLLLVALGFASVLISLPLISLDGIPTHAVGYVTGSVIPILVIGFVRRIDLARRRSPYYVPNKLLQPALVVLAVAAIVAAGLHVWPIATELAS